ncbi:septum site-determining protein MinC [Thiosulfativibrio zosterae]|uniref:Probable septum site-determining protein MinC n=1 Tax=Thiosulfativibrio zosterae TaxID=2675053 RepID=A0A6F8PNH1_9GAMM|nr:septum site-determining protein MinC [Thiosulfativibrio zosterae]BBP43662.1 putative septum site-determining protein MinC [Thiosulfativibrio zosterae]
MSKIIDLKGSILSLTVLRLHSDNIAETKAALANKIDQAPSFFAGIPVVLEPKVVLGDATYLALLLEFLRQYQMIPIGIRTEDAQLIEQAEYIGLAVFPKEIKPKKVREAEKPKTEQTAVELPEEGLKTAMLIQTSVRSGQQIFAKNRDLIIYGSVNPGAEVVADGHVHVFGKVMGKVFAGASGDTGARIFARQLKPELVCIAGAYQLAEDIPNEFQQGFVEVSLKNDNLIFNTKILD